jgi:DNA-binding response OmpR family regulator
MNPRPHILIIWNVTGDTGVLQDTLADVGEVSLAQTGEQGVRSALEGQPDLILLGANLPDMQGSRAHKALKKDLRTAEVPVLFIVGRDEADTESRALMQGAADVLHTPLRAEAVRHRVLLHLRFRRQAVRLQDADRAEEAGLQMDEWVDDLVTTAQLAARQAAAGLPLEAHCARMLSMAQNLKRALGPAGRAAAANAGTSRQATTATATRTSVPETTPAKASSTRAQTETGDGGEDHLWLPLDAEGPSADEPPPTTPG